MILRRAVPRCLALPPRCPLGMAAGSTAATTDYGAFTAGNGDGGRYGMGAYVSAYPLAGDAHLPDTGANAGVDGADGGPWSARGRSGSPCARSWSCAAS